MKASELIEILEEAVHANGGDADSVEVRIAHQPRWAFEYSVGSVAPVLTDDGPLVYIAEGNQIGYLPEQASEELGWS